jgi:hypothetical protein
MNVLGTWSPNGYGASDPNALPYVSDPRQTYSNITRDEYLNYKKEYDSFENELINKSKTDTSLIDQAKADSVSGKLPTLMQGVEERNASRYGANLTPAQLQQQAAGRQRGSTLGSIQSINDARIAQKEANTALASDLINIGQGVNRSSQGQMASAASDAQARENAYNQARSAAKAQTMSTVGQLASSAIIAYAIFASDRRMKENIEQIGVSNSGINIYEFNYKGSDDRYQGVMADEVPWAVVERSVGYNMVDYNKVDVEFRRV